MTYALDGLGVWMNSDLYDLGFKSFIIYITYDSHDGGYNRRPPVLRLTGLS